MKLGYFVAATIVGASALIAVTAQAGGDKIVFPADYDKGVLYLTIDRPDNKQYRELYTSPAAVEAAKNGRPMPSGTVITLVQYAAKLDASGVPEKGPDGRFIKTNLIGYTVMEKRTGWGTEYPDTMRNGEWESQAFRADRTPNTAANLTACFNCHKPIEPSKDFLFTYDRMKSAAR